VTRRKAISWIQSVVVGEMLTDLYTVVSEICALKLWSDRWGGTISIVYLFV